LIARLLLVAAILAPAGAHAMQLEGVQMADTLQVNGKQLLLNGMGAREATIFNVKVYIGGLYLEKPSHSPEEILSSKGPKRVVLAFLRDVSAKDIRKAWTESFERNSAPESAHAGLVQLQSLTKDMKKGDTFSFNIDEKHVEVLINDHAVGTVEGGPSFARSLLSAWIVKPPNDSLKSGMLGLKD
jgi:hypothetical protein